jgi:hypothetical protein
VHHPIYHYGKQMILEQLLSGPEVQLEIMLKNGQVCGVSVLGLLPCVAKGMNSAKISSAQCGATSCTWPCICTFFSPSSFIHTHADAFSEHGHCLRDMYG